MSHHLNPAEIKHQKRCTWAESNELMQAYHDTEWGVPLYDDFKIKEILGRKGEKTNMILASFLSKPNQSLYDTFIIDVGAKDGILVGQRVFALGNVPIGRVVEVNPNTAKVILYSNPGEKTEVVISSKQILPTSGSDGSTTPSASNTTTSEGGPASPSQGGDAFMQVTGRGGGNFEMVLPRDFVLEKGAEAVLPGITPLVLGTVQTIISDPRDSFQKALLLSPVNIFEIKFVEVEK